VARSARTAVIAGAGWLRLQGGRGIERSLSSRAG
jgi:hypothetical protein